jgi:hypothetical protein
MNQYLKIIISNVEKVEGRFDELIRDFELFYNQVNGEYKLGLWENISTTIREQGGKQSIYYISIPEDNVKDVQKIFGRYGKYVAIDRPFPADIDLVHGDPESI